MCHLLFLFISLKCRLLHEHLLAVDNVEATGHGAHFLSCDGVDFLCCSSINVHAVDTRDHVLTVEDHIVHVLDTANAEVLLDGSVYDDTLAKFSGFDFKFTFSRTLLSPSFTNGRATGM